MAEVAIDVSMVSDFFAMSKCPFLHFSFQTPYFSLIAFTHLFFFVFLFDIKDIKKRTVKIIMVVTIGGGWKSNTTDIKIMFLILILF